MKFIILNETRQRMRIHIDRVRMTVKQADQLEYYLLAQPGITDVKVYDYTGDAIIRYSCLRKDILKAIDYFEYDTPEVKALLPMHSSRSMNRYFEQQIIFSITKKIMVTLFVPQPLKSLIHILKGSQYVWKGLKSLVNKQLNVEVLDATALTISFIKKDFNTVGNVSFLLKLGSLLEELTKKKSMDDLAKALSISIHHVWKKEKNGTLRQVPMDSIQVNDEIVVYKGMMIPLDGIYLEGECLINESSMTGESLPVSKRFAQSVYAGCIVEEGECHLKVTQLSKDARYHRILKMIEDTQKSKSTMQTKANILANKLVPYTFAFTLGTFIVTRNLTKALAVLMVDFSCAIKMAIPVSILSAMREAQHHKISVKGGRFLETFAKADTIVFDKTGTLTHAKPEVKHVYAFNNQDPQEILRIAACLEEHYPHSIANAIVKKAYQEGLVHEEEHSQVEYIVAHGIASSLYGKKVIIGSYHFVFEDENVVILPEDQKQFDNIDDTYSLLYLAIDNILCGVISIEDKVRQEASKVISKLHKQGFKNVVMLTGDHQKNAKKVAQDLGINTYYGEVLPEFKASYVEDLKKQGHVVIMVGDGINDSLALSSSDCGVAISDGAPIAREVADIIIQTDNLEALVLLRELSLRLKQRIYTHFGLIVALNSSFIGFGLASMISPSNAALLHNLSTLAIGLKSTTNLLEEKVVL